MPAPRRFKQSEIDEVRNLINAIPDGTPPEPVFDREQALLDLRSDIRKRIIEDHVDVGEMVKLLNDRKFNTSLRAIQELLSDGAGRKGAAAKPRPKSVSPARKKTSMPAPTVASQNYDGASGQGTFEIPNDDADC